jgi:hypothetical protein
MRKLTAIVALTLAMLAGVSVVYAGGETIELGGLKSKAPADWKMEKASNKLRLYQFVIPKVDGDPENAELVVFFFGAGGGGSNADNIKRWKGQFLPPKGKTIDEATKTEHFKVGKDVDVLYVDIHGSYKYKNPPFDPNAKEVLKENFRRFGLIFDTDKGPYFITLTGPAKTVERNKAAFDNWIKAFK